MAAVIISSHFPALVLIMDRKKSLMILTTGTISSLFSQSQNFYFSYSYSQYAIKKRTYHVMQSCDHCGSFIFSSGLQCQLCAMNVHLRCQKFIPALCGKDHYEKRGRLKVKISINEGYIYVKEGLIKLDTKDSLSMAVGREPQAKLRVKISSNLISDAKMRIKLLASLRSAIFREISIKNLLITLLARVNN